MPMVAEFHQVKIALSKSGGSDKRCGRGPYRERPAERPASGRATSVGAEPQDVGENAAGPARCIAGAQRRTLAFRATAALPLSPACVLIAASPPQPWVSTPRSAGWSGLAS